MNQNRLQAKGPSLYIILQDVGASLEVAEVCILSSIRKPEWVMARRIYAYVATMITDATYKSIGSMIFKDHSMVIEYNRDVAKFNYTNDALFLEYWTKYTANSKIWGAHEIIIRRKNEKTTTANNEF